MKKKWLSLLLAVVMVLGALSGCGEPADNPSDPSGPSDSGQTGTETQAPTQPSGSTETERPEGAAAEQVVKLFYSDEISDWNPLHPSSGSTWANWIDSLVEYDNYGMCQPCLAESWTTSEDGLIWTFKIREGVKWQRQDGSEYGTDVVAEDWVTSA